MHLPYTTTYTYNYTYIHIAHNIAMATVKRRPIKSSSNGGSKRGTRSGDRGAGSSSISGNSLWKKRFILLLVVAVVVGISAVALYYNKNKVISPKKERQFTPGEDAAAAKTPTRPLPPGVERPPKAGKGLRMWDPIAVNHTRELALDNSGKVYTMKTLAMDPPVFEIEDFLTDLECGRILDLATERGLMKSDSTYLDASNKGKGRSDGKLNAEEADKLFRYSDQTWLPPEVDPALVALKARVASLAMLPHRVSRQSEEMQVVKYVDHGHYESHYDSESDHLGPCCIDERIAGQGYDTGVRALDLPLTKRCRLCRFLTILYYLVDTEEGGGTVFPLADATDTELNVWEHSNHETKYKQTRTCSPGLVSPPKKRKAIMWYNHNVDNGFLGKKLLRSLHGGCNVIRGQKWIANHWISERSHGPIESATGHY